MPYETQYALKMSCLRKIRNTSKEQAQKRIDRLKELGRPGADKMRVYSCDNCGGWHIGTPGSGETKREMVEFLNKHLPGMKIYDKRH